MPFKTKRLYLPAFFPDATYGTIHSVPLHLLPKTNQGIIITTLHYHILGLDNHPIKAFISLLKNKIVLSDSGGFQVLSLIHNRKQGEINTEGATFQIEGKTYKLTPESSQTIQHKLGSDIRVVLDYPLMGDEDEKLTRKSLRITTEWAARAKEQFLKLVGISEAEFKKTSPTIQKDTYGKKYIEFERPLLFAVVQGGNFPELRAQSAKALSSIGFDGYGFGGWPLTPEGKFNTQIVKAFAENLPKEKLLYGMGIGTPDDIKESIKLGLLLFDCVIPTRNARHGLIYVSKGEGETKGETYDVLHIKNSKYANDYSPLDPTCNCPVCQNYTRSYIRFLLKSKNPVSFTLASLHNLYFYERFLQK